MKWYSYLICCLIIIAGIFCSIELVNIFSVKSGEYGSIITFESKNNYNEISKFDFGTIEFDTEDYINYTSTTTYAPTNFDGTKKEYLMFFNEQPLNNIVSNAGRLSGEISIRFYNLEGEEITTAKLNFVIEFTANLTKVSVTTIDEDQSSSYLNSYMQINGAVLRVVTKEAII